MNDEYVKPFADALRNTVKMMAGLTPEIQPPYFKGNKTTPGEVSGMIGIAGRNFVGTITLKFPQLLAKKIYNLMTGSEEDTQELEKELYDAVSELANIVAGSGKKILSEKGINFNIVVPPKPNGKLMEIRYAPRANVVVVPFSIEGEQFHMELMLNSFAA